MYVRVSKARSRDGSKPEGDTPWLAGPDATGGSEERRPASAGRPGEGEARGTDTVGVGPARRRRASSSGTRCGARAEHATAGGRTINRAGPRSPSSCNRATWRSGGEPPPCGQRPVVGVLQPQEILVGAALVGVVPL